MIVSAKEFAKKTGFPVKLIRRMCRTGQLEYWQSGRVYLLDDVKAAATMQLFKAVPIYTPVQKKDHSRTIKKLPQQYGSRTERLKAMLKNRCNGKI